MKKWNEIRIAYLLAQHGTITKTAEQLNVHRSTVIRHIDALEQELNAKLFIRTAKGYIPTTAGQDLMKVARSTDEQFNLLINRTKGQLEELSGDFIITSLNHVVPILIPLLAEFQQRYPKLTIRHLISEEIFKLEYGEAHVAIRTGEKPLQEENIAAPLLTHTIALFASEDYLNRYGEPDSISHLNHHYFIGPDNIEHRAPFYQWLFKTVTEQQIKFRSNDHRIMKSAIEQGMGIGFVFKHDIVNTPTLRQVMPSLEWQVPHWVVTHKDLNNTAKVQAFLQFMQEKKLELSLTY